MISVPPKKMSLSHPVLHCKLLRPQGSFEGSTTLSVLNWAFARIALLDPQFFSYPQRSCFIACKEFHEHSSHKEIRKFAMDNQVQNEVVQDLNCNVRSKTIQFDAKIWVGNSFFFCQASWGLKLCHRKLETSYITSNYSSEESCPHDWRKGWSVTLESLWVYPNANL